MSERRSAISKEYIESTGSFDFGYFHLLNLCEQENLEPDFSEFVQNKITGINQDTVMIYFTVPNRPIEKKPLENKIEEIDLSVAELAGVSTGIALLRQINNLFYSLQPPGLLESSWFNSVNMFDPDNPSRPGKLPINQNDGTEGQIYYLTGDELLISHDISLFQKEDEIRIKLGGIGIEITDSTYIHADTKPPTRKDLHILRGFIQTYALWTFTKSSRSAYLRLVDRPLHPYTDLDGLQPAENIIEIDRIKSYV